MGEYRYDSEKNPLPDEPKETLTLANGVSLIVMSQYCQSYQTIGSLELPHAVSKDDFRVTLWLGFPDSIDRLEVADTIYTPTCKTVVRDIVTSCGVGALLNSTVITSYAEVDKIGEAVERVTTAMNRLLAGLVNT